MEPVRNDTTADRRTAVELAKRLLVDLIWRTAKIEVDGVTFPDTQEIFDGRAPEGMSVDDIVTVNNIKRAWGFLLGNIDYPVDWQYIREYNRIIYELQGRGYRIIIAHPERYKAIQKNPGLATDLMRNGCKLQASADFLNGGRTLSFGGGKIKKTAVKLFEDMRYSYIASDAHNVKHYKAFKKAIDTYDLRGSHAAS